MQSLILQTATRWLKPMLLLFSIFILIEGHNDPGGGFVGGLLAATAFALHMIAYDAASTRKLMRVDPQTLTAAGLLVAITSGVPALLDKKMYMTGLWGKIDVLEIGTLDLGSPLMFDIGVYLLVLGIAMMILLALWEA